MLCETIREHDRISPTDQYEWAIERLLTAVGSRATSLARVPEVLCHGDVTGADCLVTDRGVGLLDWEMAHVGDPVRSLYRARRALCDPLEHPPEATLDALHDGYCAHAGSLPDGFDDRKPIYHAQRLVVLAGFADRLADWFPDRDLHAWLAGELDRRLSRIE